MSSYSEINWSSNAHPRWYEYSTVLENFEDFDLYVKHFHDCVDWISENIEGWHKHVVFDCTYGQLKFRFRHERDYMIFLLRWR